MELHTEVWSAGVANSFVTAIICVDKQFGPIVWKSIRINCETMVLGCDMTFSSHHVGTRDVVPTVSELHLEGICTSSSSQQLMSQADTENWCSVLCHCR